MISVQIKTIKSHTNTKVVSGSYVNPDEVLYVIHKEPEKKWGSTETTFIFKNGDEMVLDTQNALYFKEVGQIGIVKFDQNRFNEVSGKSKETPTQIWNRKL